MSSPTSIEEPESSEPSTGCSPCSTPAASAAASRTAASSWGLAAASWDERWESAPLLAPSTLTQEEEEEESVASGVFSSEPQTGGKITFLPVLRIRKHEVRLLFYLCYRSGIRGLFLTLEPESGISFSGSRIPNPYFDSSITKFLGFWLKNFSSPIQK